MPKKKPKAKLAFLKELKQIKRFKSAPKPANKKANSAGLPSAISIAKVSWLVIWRHKKAFTLIILIYGLAYLVLVLGLSSPGNVSALKKEFSGHFSSIYSGVGIFAYLVGSTSSSATPDGSAYQVFIIIIASLSLIWALRQVNQGAKVRARDSYYRGLYPLIPYVLVLLYIAIELIPLIGGLGLYGLLITGGIAVSVIEKILSIILILGLISISCYLICSSIVGLYIVTLPNMTPIKALRSAKNLVKGHRWLVFRKLIFLPVLIFIVGGLVMLPFILAAPAVAVWLFFILTLIALAYIHSYLYTLYRGLINDQS